jgi:hypothetical protein
VYVGVTAAASPERYSAPVVVLAGYLVAAGVAIGCVWAVAGRGYRVARDPAVDLGAVAGQHVGIVGGLAGFAVTGLVLLVTLGRDLPDASATSFTTLITMFFVAYLGFFATSLLYANISDPGPSEGFDLPAALFAVASITLNLTVLLGYLALIPLFETFDLPRLAEIARWILVATIIAGYWMLAHHLYRTGHARLQLLVTMFLLAVFTTLVFAALAGWLGWRSPDSTLLLTLALGFFGAAAFAFHTALPILARQE